MMDGYSRQVQTGSVFEPVYVPLLWTPLCPGFTLSVLSLESVEHSDLHPIDCVSGIERIFIFYRFRRIITIDNRAQ